ncbi:MAG: hypothetical protein ACM3H9_08995 [Rhodospirillaceae bacterium]|jgi:hypothetical protein
MILVRDVFRLKYGQARPALALWKEGRSFLENTESAAPARLLTDLVGQSYTLVLEMTFQDLPAYERASRSVMGRDGWRAWYQKFVPLVESGYREIFNIVE